MTVHVLFATAFPEGLRKKLEPAVTVIGPFDDPLAGTPATEEVRVLVTMGTLKTDAAVMDRLPDLGLICCYGTGYEGVDLETAAKRGIVVTYSPEANAASVADHAMALLLAANRRIVAADKFVREGKWRGNAAARMPIVRGLTGRRLGIFGLGSIGRKIAQRAASFEVEIAYHNRSRKADVVYTFHETLQSLADWADILMIAARAGASNRHAVNREVLRALGPDGIVVNIARGSIIDEDAMIALLQSGELGCAGLDVFEQEPFVPDALKQLQQVILGPHIAGGTVEAHEAMQNLVASNIMAFLAGQKVMTPVPR